MKTLTTDRATGDPWTRPQLLAEIADTLSRTGTVGVSWAVVENGVVVGQGAAGTADRRTAVPVTTSTLFPGCSMAKMVTALCVLRLVDEGLLSLATPVGATLTGWVPGGI